MTYLQIKNLSKQYLTEEKEISVLEDINLLVDNKEFVSIIGPNGCGKTTLLKIIAGIEEYQKGELKIESLNGKLRKSFIFQEYMDSLFPWLTVEENILFPFSLKNNKSNLKDAKERLTKLLKELKISLPLQRHIYELSGGQKQLVSILRALVFESDIILMDEPFNSVSYETRNYLQRFMLKVKGKSTILFVSHNIDEILRLSDKIVVMNYLPGQILQVFDLKKLNKESLEKIKKEILGLAGSKE